jgi:hypothetical protein
MPDTPPRQLFREEAVEYHARQRGLGNVLSASPRWSRLAFLGLLLLFALAGVASMLVGIGETASGPALVEADGSTAVAVLPDSARSQLDRTRRLDLQLTSGERMTVQLSSQSIRPVDPETAIHLFGVDAMTDLLVPSRKLVLVRGDLVPRGQSTAFQTGQVSADIGSRPLLVALLAGTAPSRTGG